MKNIFIMFIIFFCSNCKIEAQQKITVSAFYSDYVAKYDKLPDPSWSCGMFVQARILHEFYLSKNNSHYRFPTEHFIANLAPGAIFSNIVVETDKQTFKPRLPNELVDIMNNPDYIPRSVSYSFAPPLSYCAKYPVQALYVAPTFQSWYLADKNNVDTIDVEFNIEPTLFYLRTSRPVSYVNRKPTMRFLSNEIEPSFYLFYLPAYNHYTLNDDGVFIDILIENIDSTKTDRRDIVYNKDYIERDSLDIERLKSVRCCLDTWIGKDCSPDTLYVVKSPLSQKITMGKMTRTFTTSWAHTHDKFSSFFIDSDLFYTHSMMHELMHCYVKRFQAGDVYEQNFFKESLIEYLTCFLYDSLFSVTTFSDKIEKMEKDGQTIKIARKLLKTNKSNGISFGGKEYDTNWIYYDLLPCRLHEYAERNGNEERFVETIISYLKKLDENNAPSFKEFSEYMKENGFRNVDGVYKL